MPFRHNYKAIVEHNIPLYPCHTYRRSAGDRCALLDFEHFHKAQ